MFVKNAKDDSGSKNYGSLIFIMFMSHFYIITDKETIKSIATAFSNKNSHFKSNLIADDEIKE